MRIKMVVTLKDGTKEEIMGDLVKGDNGHWSGGLHSIQNPKLKAGISKAMPQENGMVKARLRLEMPEGVRFASALFHHFSAMTGDVFFDVRGGLVTDESRLRPWQGLW